MSSIVGQERGGVRPECILTILTDALLSDLELNWSTTCGQQGPEIDIYYACRAGHGVPQGPVLDPVVNQH